MSWPTSWTWIHLNRNWDDVSFAMCSLTEPSLPVDSYPHPLFASAHARSQPRWDTNVTKLGLRHVSAIHYFRLLQRLGGVWDSYAYVSSLQILVGSCGCGLDCLYIAGSRCPVSCFFFFFFFNKLAHIRTCSYTGASQLREASFSTHLL